MSEREKWQGMLTIARLNWPFYLAVTLIALAAIVGLFILTGTLLKALDVLALLGCVYFLFGSLGVSHWIYDRSDLYRWKWLTRALRSTKVEKVIFCHSGFDEASESLRAEIKASDWQVLDHFDREQMTEASIRRARELFPPTAGTLPASFDQWPVETKSADLVFGILAIHEFRSVEERCSWFSEARRVLLPEGRIILVEHVRDLANFLAFGPGFFHFHSRKNWQKSWEAAQMNLIDEFRVTPWVRVFVLQKA